MQKYGTHGDGIESLHVGDTVSTPTGETGIIVNLILETVPRYIVQVNGVNKAYSRFELTRINI